MFGSPEDGDRKIARLCTELLAVKQKAALTRTLRRNEISQLKRKLDEKQTLYHQRLFASEWTNSQLAAQREALESVFKDIYIPAFACSLQARLCKSIHTMAQAEKELIVKIRNTRHEVEHMEREIRRITEERAEVEIQCLNLFFHVEQDIRDARKQLDEYPLVDALSYSSSMGRSKPVEGDRISTAEPPDDDNSNSSDERDESSDDSWKDDGKVEQSETGLKVGFPSNLLPSADSVTPCLTSPLKSLS